MVLPAVGVQAQWAALNDTFSTTKKNNHLFSYEKKEKEKQKQTSYSIRGGTVLAVVLSERMNSKMKVQLRYMRCPNERTVK